MELESTGQRGTAPCNRLTRDSIRPARACYPLRIRLHHHPHPLRWDRPLECSGCRGLNNQIRQRTHSPLGILPAVNPSGLKIGRSAHQRFPCQTSCLQAANCHQGSQRNPDCKGSRSEPASTAEAAEHVKFIHPKKPSQPRSSTSPQKPIGNVPSDSVVVLKKSPSP